MPTRTTEPNPFAHRTQRPRVELIPDVLAAELRRNRFDVRFGAAR